MAFTRKRKLFWLLSACFFAGALTGLFASRGSFNWFNLLFIRDGMTREQVEEWIGPGSEDGAEVYPFVFNTWEKSGVEGTRFVIWRKPDSLGGEYVIMCFRDNRLIAISHFVPCP
jgi:hypothetical protein